MILHGKPSALAKYFSLHMAVLRSHFCAECASPVLYVTSGHPRSDFDIFAVSGDSTSLVGVRVLSCSPIQLFSTAFDPREWTIVVFWKEDSGRQLQLITPETKEEMRPVFHHHLDFLFFDDPDVPLGPWPPGPLLAPPGRQRQRSRSLDRVQSCAQAPQAPQVLI